MQLQLFSQEPIAKPPTPRRSGGAYCSASPVILDACCGSRMFWFNREHPQAVYMDNRRESHELKDKSSAGGKRMLVIDPDLQADFTCLPFPDCSFSLVIFDPPHLVNNGKNGWLAKKYGKLGRDWREDIKAGFCECFRVLKPEGVLVFKWNETDIRVSEILRLSPVEPLIGHKSGKNMNTHWLLLMKS